MAVWNADMSRSRRVEPRLLLARPRKWTDEQRAEAERLYVGVGLAEASMQTGIPKGTIVSWAHEQGLQTFGNSSTREATAAAIERRKLKREKIREGLHDMALDALARRNQEHIEFKGKDATRVTYRRRPRPHSSPMPRAWTRSSRIFAWEGGVSARTEMTLVKDAIRDDHERDILRAAIERELTDRGEPIR
jgi:transposase-like protein